MWIPKHLVNNTFKQKVFRVSLNTVIKKDAVKLSYKIRTVLYAFEDRYLNAPDSYGEALLAMKTKTSRMNDEVEQGEIDFNHGLVIKSQLDGIDLKSREFGTQDYISQFTQYDMDCYELTQKQETQNPVISVSQPDQSLEETLKKVLDERDAVPDDVDEVLQVIFDIWEDTVPINSKTKDHIRDVWLFIRYIGEDKRIREITLKHINDYKEFKVFIPKQTRINDLSIPEIKKLECPDDKRNGRNTLTPHFKRIATFLKWCRTGGSNIQHIEDSSYEERLRNLDYIELFNVPSGKTREPFTDNDLKKLFQSKLFVSNGHNYGDYKQNTGDFKTSAFYWVQLLALFTGARQGELCQLRRDDVYQYEGTKIWILNLKENLKTEGSIRKIPIHKQILDLGFIKYVESVNEERIFPDEERKINKKTGLGEGFKKFSSRWSGYRDGLKIIPSDNKHEKVFHCFRHTVETRLSELSKTGKPSERFDSGLVDAIVGHKSDKRSTGEEVYNHADYVEEKSKALNRLQYDFIDFEKMVRWNSCSFARKGFIKR